MNFRSAALLATTCLISACATVMDGQTQIVTIKTPGTTQALCALDNGTVVYKARSDETFQITKNDQDMKVHCVAPGNRERVVMAKWTVDGWVVANVVNGIVPGLTYDHFSKG